MKSLFDNQKRCYICLAKANIHKHHIYGAANRSNSEKWGEWVYLCAYHHNGSDKGVHFNSSLNSYFKAEGQRKFESRLGTREDFVKIFGRNYLEDDDSK